MMKYLVFIMLFMVGCAGLIPNIGTCIATGEIEIGGKKESTFTCFYTNSNGGYIVHEGKKYECEYSTTDSSELLFKVDINLLEVTGEIYVDVNKQRIRCSVQ